MNKQPRRDQSRCLTIMYHYVGRHPTLSGEGIVAILEAAFERQLDRLCAEMEPIDWVTFWRWQRDGGTVPERCFLLTFDDGLSDHARTAATILEGRGLKGLFFLSSECLSKRRLAPPHQIHALFASLGSARLDEEIGRWLRDHGVNDYSLTEEARSAAMTRYGYELPVRARIKYLLTHILPLELRDQMLIELATAHIGDTGELAHRWYMTLEELQALQNAGHSLGGHGHSHHPYERLNRDEQQADLQKAAEWLRDHFGRRPRPFSYPYGSFDFRTPALCRETGFAAAFTTWPGWNERTTNAYQLHRIDTIAVESFLEQEAACPL